jgi:hypothetical protein
MEDNKYQKQKDAIYKWRNANKEKYLLSQARYFKNKMEDPIKREIQYLRNKDSKLKNEIKNGIVKRRVGRPRKHNI